MEEVVTICCRRDIQDTEPPHMNTTAPEIERRVWPSRISIIYETEVCRATQVVKQLRNGHAGPIGTGPDEVVKMSIPISRCLL
jgi:hypothetical protein